LLILGLTVFGGAFAVYLHFLGWVDGLPQLPPEYLVRRTPNEPLPKPQFSAVEQKLQLAFGSNCIELNYIIQIELHSKGIVLAANEFGFVNGKVKLAPFSLATIKERPGGGFPEINVVHCDVAILEFDKPVKTANDMNGKKIVACELQSDPDAPTFDPRRGKIRIRNNRGTSADDDDLCLETPGPIFYREADQRIYTRAAVKLLDLRDQPQATIVDAQGMEVFLAVESSEPAPGAPARPGKRTGSISGVRRVVLTSNVRMDLWLDPKDGFLANGPTKPAAAPSQTPAKRENVQITTPGPFYYDVQSDGARARFERLPSGATQLANNCVHVVRPQSNETLGTIYDQLECDFLEMQFANRPPPKPAASVVPMAAPPKAAGDDRSATVDWIHAWGQHIVMTSDEKNLAAHGTDLVHDAKAKSTTVRGEPRVVVLQNGHQLFTPELVLYGADSKDAQQAVARGPGEAHLLTGTADPKQPSARGGPASPHVVVASWRDQCVYRKEEAFNLLTLTGDAVFEDPANGHRLRADQIRLWLTPDQPQPAAAVKAPAGGPTANPNVRPRKMEATGQVAVRSPDLTIHDTELLVLMFREAAPRPVAPPGADLATRRPDEPRAGTAPGATAPGPASPAPPPRPFDVAARSVEAYLTLGEDGLALPGQGADVTKAPGGSAQQTQLERVYCVGNVRVHQDPEKPGDRPLEVLGKELDLTRAVTGNVLEVHGTPTEFGQVQLPEMKLLGTRIRIDQVQNTAEVDGRGVMQMASKTDFEGNQLAKPTDLIVTWKRGMNFNGKEARFYENVGASQDNKILQCENMQVYLIRPVSLNQRPGEPKGPNAETAQVDKVVCDSAGQPQGVTIVETEFDARGLLKYQRIECSELTLKKEEGLVEARVQPLKPGYVRLLQRGPKGEPGGGLMPTPTPSGRRGAAPTPAQPVEEEYKYTLVRFEGKMVVNNHSRTAHFFNANGAHKVIDVLHMPIGDDGAVRDLPSFEQLVNNLPTGAMHLQCDQLSIRTRPKDAQGREFHEMQATGNGAEVQWEKQFYGKADLIAFDEASQKMTLQGKGDGNFAVAQKLTRGPGDQPVKAKVFTYNRLTGEFNVVQSLGGN
jgi:hypothetical protein